MQTGNDFSSNIGVDKFFGKFEMFSKDIELPALKTEKEGRNRYKNKEDDVQTTR